MVGVRTPKIPSVTQKATRRGARAPNLVTPDIRRALEAGEPSVNHMEQIAIDMGCLLANTFSEFGQQADRLRTGGLVCKMRVGGEILWEGLGEEAWSVTAQHQSDSVRGWGAMAVGACPARSLVERLALVEPFADDPHFAVREWAWLALRPHIVKDPREAIELLTPWTSSSSPRLRRFASEVTRPRGVWSVHIPVLKQTPQLALGLLDALHADPELYVQNSVGNWLNDASKTTPTWVKHTCRAWLDKSNLPSTHRICKRAMRNLGQPG